MILKRFIRNASGNPRISVPPVDGEVLLDRHTVMGKGNDLCTQISLAIGDMSYVKKSGE
jgi:hypothetical protein